MKRAIVLSGGGAQGAYQIGVWKALRKLHIKYDIVTGTSVGAMNGALMVQKDYWKAVRMWKNVDFSLIFNENLTNDYNTPDGKKEIIKMYAKNILLNGGMDVSKLEETVEDTLNLRRFYKSKINYGLVLVQLPTLKPKLLTKNEMPKEQLKDYIVASATCFPAFKKKQIDDKKFIDGGYYDSLPINLAIDMGAEEVIAVDLNTIGIKQPIKKKSVKVTTIVPRNDLGHFLVFRKDIARRNIKFGYNDAMKSFGKLDGDKYTFKQNHLRRNFKKHKNDYTELFQTIFKTTEQSNSIISNLFQKANYSKIINGNIDAVEQTFNKNIEYLGKILGVDDAEIYSIRKYNHLLYKKLLEVDNLNAKLVEQKIKNSDIKSLLDTGLVIKYIYNKLTMIEDDPKAKRDLSKVALILSKEFMSATYIYIVNKKKINQ